MIIDGGGLWREFGRTDWDFCPALFLDRDGVVIADIKYVGRAQDVRLIDGAAAAIARCNALRIPVVLVTNQSGIARGLYDWKGFHAVQLALCSELSAADAHFDAVLACAYHAAGKGALRMESHPWRKPNPGMILAAASGMNLDLARSWIVGDRARDLAAGASAGLAGGILVAADERERQDASLLASARFLVDTAANAADAIAGLMDSARLAR